jgi:hypothetical protein
VESGRWRVEGPTLGMTGLEVLSAALRQNKRLPKHS